MTLQKKQTLRTSTATTRSVGQAGPAGAPTLVDHADLRTLFGIKFSRTHLWRLVREGRFPPPVSLYDGGIRKCWRSRDIEEWVSKLRYANTPGAAAD